MPATARSSRSRERSLDGSPKRSESSTAIGRAPIAKMSRRIPPTPVAAPWNGSTAVGWVWDSAFDAAASPAPPLPPPPPPLPPPRAAGGGGGGGGGGAAADLFLRGFLGRSARSTAART